MVQTPIGYHRRSWRNQTEYLVTVYCMHPDILALLLRKSNLGNEYIPMNQNPLN